MAEFRPSQLSYSPREHVLTQLRKLREALDRIETHLATHEDTPNWILQRLSRALAEFGTVFNYIVLAESKVSESKTKTKRTK